MSGRLVLQDHGQKNNKIISVESHIKFAWTKICNLSLWFVRVRIHCELKMDKQDLEAG